jgi:hypothetical protein
MRISPPCDAYEIGNRRAKRGFGSLLEDHPARLQVRVATLPEPLVSRPSAGWQWRASSMRRGFCGVLGLSPFGPPALEVSGLLQGEECV